MIPTIRQISKRQWHLENNEAMTIVTMDRDMTKDTCEDILYHIRKNNNLDNPFVDEFFADIEDRRSAVLIQGVTNSWESIAYIFNDLGDDDLTIRCSDCGHIYMGNEEHECPVKIRNKMIDDAAEFDETYDGPEL